MYKESNVSPFRAPCEPSTARRRSARTSRRSPWRRRRAWGGTRRRARASRACCAANPGTRPRGGGEGREWSALIGAEDLRGRRGALGDEDGVHGVLHLDGRAVDELRVRLRQTDERLEQPRRRPSGVALLGVPLQEEVRVEQPAGGAQPVGVARVGRRERAVEAVRLLRATRSTPSLGQRPLLPLVGRAGCISAGTSTRLRASSRMMCWAILMSRASSCWSRSTNTTSKRERSGDGSPMLVPTSVSASKRRALRVARREDRAARAQL